MPAPINGSSAYRYKEVLRPRKKSPKRAVSAKKRLAQKRRAVFSNTLMIICVTALAFLLLFRYALITEKCSYAVQLREEHQELQDSIVQKRFENEKNIDLAKVEEIARTKLGMQRPEKHQTMYVDMESSDYVEVASLAADKDSIFALFMGRMSKLLEYLH